MLTTWLTLTAFLSASAIPRTVANGRDALTVAPTFRVKGQVGAELTFNCGDGKSRGVVEHWHTPFGDPYSLGERDPVCVRHDGSLVLTNLSSLHAGPYHCLLRLARGSTLFPYDLQVHHKERGGRFEREVRSAPEEKAGEEEGVSDGEFAGAVAASVILTFVVGFGAGALSRAHVLRCLGAITQKLPRTRRPEPRSDVTVATLPPMCENQAFSMERLHDSDTADGDTVDSTLSTTSFPPAKPKRSFRDKRHQGDQETAAYLEACDRHREEETETETARGRAEGTGCDGRTQEDKLEPGRINQSGASENSEDRSKDGEQEIKVEVEMEKEEREEPGEQEDTDRSKRQEEKTEEEEEDIRSKRQEEKTEEEEEDISARTSEEEETDSREQSSTDTEEEEAGSEKEEDTSKGSKDGDGGGEEAVSSSAPSRGRRSRVIRLYQYDEEGQRFCHLPKPGPEETPVPAPRLKARSASLTRLSAIMAAAAAGPLDTAVGPLEGEADQTDGQVKARFQMDI